MLAVHPSKAAGATEHGAGDVRGIEMIDHVIKFQNGMVLVFDEKGEQMPEFQGRYEEVRAKILAHTPRSAKFFHGVWNVCHHAVSRKEW